MKKQKQEQWTAALGKIREVQEEARKEQALQMENLQRLVQGMTTATGPDIWTQLKHLMPDGETEEEKARKRAEEEERNRNKESITKLEQQRLIQEEIATIAKGNLDEDTRTMLGSLLRAPTEPATIPVEDTQAQLIEQLKRTLAAKEAEDPQKAILWQFLTKSNTINTMEGATTLKPQLLKQLSGEEEDFQYGKMAGHVQQTRAR